MAVHRLEFLRGSEKKLLSDIFDGFESGFLRLTLPAIEQLIHRPLRVKTFLLSSVMKAAEEDLRWLQSYRGFAVAFDEKEYPPLLKEIDDPPFLLFGRGVGELGQMGVSVVGTRLATGKAHRACFEICRYLSERGVGIISGLAKGIDATAHAGALAGGGQTTAVLGNGIDYVYPAENRSLARRILENGGLILSEFPPGTEVRKYRFPSRNRIISGLTPLCIIVQAPDRSGALITAGQALDQGRDVAVLAAGIEDHCFGAGTIRLAEQGAPVWGSGNDIESWLQRYKEIYGCEENNERKEENNTDYCRVSGKSADD